MIPPVDVPTIRSKYVAIGCPSDCSSVARKDPGKTPLIPPPSIERIRLIASLSRENTNHGGADARVRLRLPDLKRPQHAVQPPSISLRVHEMFASG